jgi:hypothetical protein
MFSLSALAALLAMAFVGASSTMAETTALCLNDSETSCTAVTHHHESTLAGSQAVLKTNILTIKCDVLFLSTSVGSEASPLIVKGNFTYSNCNNSCVILEENGPAEIKVLVESHETSKVTGKGALLSTETNGEVKITAQKVKEEGGSFFCPDTSELTITTTPLTKTYLKRMRCEPLKKGLYLLQVTTSLCSHHQTGSGEFELYWK